jgi:hypothetical protein
VRNSRRFRISTLACLCLGFTGSGVGWADVAHHADFYVEDPYADHVTNGSTARLGTAVGFIYGEPTDVLALGLEAAMGQRFGRFAVEAEYAYLGFQSRGQYMTALGPTDGDVSLGSGHRLGVLARYEVIRIGPKTAGPNSMVALYVEAGADTAWNHWSRPGYNEASRLVPDDTKRVEGLGGFGLLIEHRLQEPIGFPRRVGWFLGWRMAMSPHEAMTGSICRGSGGVSCSVVPMMDQGGYVDRSMLFQSSLEFTF